MKILSGSDLAAYIKQRQAGDVRSLRQSRSVNPKLAIIKCTDDPVIETYVKLKKRYGEDILVGVDIHNLKQTEVRDKIKELNKDITVNGIIVQLPLADPSETDEIVNLVAPEKDVDALGAESLFEPATPMAILWLLAGHNIDLKGKDVLLIGRGKLVGGPLEKILLSSNIDVKVADRNTKDLKTMALNADVIVTATGSPSILYSSMIKPGAVVVDAGVASEEGKTIGDVADDVYKRDDISMTPAKGGVGPLTVCALFENVISAARKQAESN
jgi:methylenetetrahydrofolate dehydrogenase (NADP+)/methenyltetrahydrofolate cyclohydrolase